MNEAAQRPIILAGFMATGKTTVGQILAERLQREFIDMDELIVQRTGCAIADLFAKYGERFFRTIEKGICHELSIRRSMVISTGGGALMDADSRAVMLAHGFVVCLLADPAVIEQRLRLSSDRPLAPTWRELLAARMPVYQSFPLQMDTTHKNPDQIAEEILSLWFSRLQ